MLIWYGISVNNTYVGWQVNHLMNFAVFGNSLPDTCAVAEFAMCCCSSVCVMLMSEHPRETVIVYINMLYIISYVWNWLFHYAYFCFWLSSSIVTALIGATECVWVGYSSAMMKYRSIVAAAINRINEWTFMHAVFHTVSQAAVVNCCATWKWLHIFCATLHYFVCWHMGDFY